MKQRGRMRMSDALRRNNKIMIALTENEREQIEQRVLDGNFASISEYIRSLLVKDGIAVRGAVLMRR